MRLGISYTLENVVDGVLAVDIVLKIKEHPKMAIKVSPSPFPSCWLLTWHPRADTEYRLGASRGWQEPPT